MKRLMLDAGDLEKTQHDGNLMRLNLMAGVIGPELSNEGEGIFWFSMSGLPVLHDALLSHIKGFLSVHPWIWLVEVRMLPMALDSR